MAGVKKVKSVKKVKKSGGGGIGKILAILIVIGALVACGIVFGPRLVHKCSNCDKVFVGTGYYPNVISSTISNIKKEDEKILCADCARDEHKLELTLGKSLEDFKRPLFEEKKTEEKKDNKKDKKE